LSDLRNQLRSHGLYFALKSIEDIQVFMENHVFAVWDFMSLIKTLQLKLTCVSIPWIPSGQPAITRFINEIVFSEESNIDENNEPSSHFEMYLDAMTQVGANKSEIDSLIKYIQSGNNILPSINRINIDKKVKEFLQFFFNIIDTEKKHYIASAFTFGRENIIPDMFIRILKKLIQKILTIIN